MSPPTFARGTTLGIVLIGALAFAVLLYWLGAGTGQASDNGAEQLTQIRRMDLDALSQQFTQTVQPVYLDQLDMQPEAAALEPVVFPDLDGGPPHLSYTIQWFIFSLAVIAGWLLAVRNAANERSGKPKKKKVPPIAEHYASGG